MAVFPESMDKLNVEDPGGSLSIVENYIRYMGERIEFSMRNMTKTVSAAGVSSAEMYILVTAMDNTLSALQSTVNGLSGNVTALQGQVTSLLASADAANTRLDTIDSQLAALETRVKALEDKQTGGTT